MKTLAQIVITAGVVAGMVAGCTHYHLANPYSLPNLRAIAGRLLREARDFGLTTSLDTAWDSKGEWMQVLGPCLPHLDLLFVNEDEARMLTGAGDPSLAARHLIDAGARALIVKLGDRGSVLFEDGVRVDTPAFQVPVVDTTGAGDCCVGGFLAGLWKGFPVVEALRLANAVGARSVGALGSTTGLLGLEDTLGWPAGREPLLSAVDFLSREKCSH